MKIFKNNIIVFLIGMLIPMILGYVYQVPGLNLKASNVLSQETDHSEVREAKSKLQNLYDVDVQEYQRLKNLEAKYSKANDILAKMMTIFLADLGLRISKNDIVEMVAESQIEASAFKESNEESSHKCPDRTEPVSCPSLS